MNNRPGMLSSPFSLARQTMTSEKLFIRKGWRIGKNRTKSIQAMYFR